MIDDDDEVRWRFEPSGPVRSTQFCWHCSGSSRSAFQNVWLLTTIITTSIFSSSSGSNTGTKAQVLQSIQLQNWPTNSAADNSKFDGLHSQGIELGCLHSKSSNSTVGTSNPGTERCAIKINNSTVRSPNECIGWSAKQIFVFDGPHDNQK